MTEHGIILRLFSSRTLFSFPKNCVFLRNPKIPKPSVLTVYQFRLNKYNRLTSYKQVIFQGITINLGESICLDDSETSLNFIHLNVLQMTLKSKYLCVCLCTFVFNTPLCIRQDPRSPFSSSLSFPCHQISFLILLSILLGCECFPLCHLLLRVSKLLCYSESGDSQYMAELELASFSCQFPQTLQLWLGERKVLTNMALQRTNSFMGWELDKASEIASYSYRFVVANVSSVSAVKGERTSALTGLLSA